MNTPLFHGRQPESLGADRVGRFCALSHQRPQWGPTDSFIHQSGAELLRIVQHLQALGASCPPAERSLLAVLEAILQREAAVLKEAYPPHLPFLGVDELDAPGPRPRIVAVMREWLLMAPHARDERHLQDFLAAYQEISPLSLCEIRTLPGALRLALAERCGFLPRATSPEHQHLDLLPNLIRRTYHSFQFVEQTEWKTVGENISRVHHLLARDPAQIYPRMDFLSRDAYRHAVEEIARAAGTSETSVAARAIALAGRRGGKFRKHANHVGYFLLGREREAFCRGLIDQRSRASETDSPPPLPSAPRGHGNSAGSLLRLDFRAAIPSDEQPIFVLQVEPADEEGMSRAIDELRRTATLCRAAHDVQLGLLVPLQGHFQHKNPIVRQAKEALLSLNGGRPPAALFVHSARLAPPPGDPMRVGSALLLPFTRARDPGWFRQTAAFWAHPLNRIGIRTTKAGNIRRVFPEIAAPPEGFVARVPAAR